MKIIKKLAEMIDDELDGACEYAKEALMYKDERPGLADTFYKLSMVEMEHMTTLHKLVVDMINEYKDKNGDPPDNMMALYNYIHEKQIDHANKVKCYQEQYKTS